MKLIGNKRTIFSL